MVAKLWTHNEWLIIFHPFNIILADQSKKAEA